MGISIKNLDLYYDDFHALKNINMEIYDKDITAFIGPSGCGKSTLLRCFNRMNDLVEGCRITGELQVDGVDILSRSLDVNILRKNVGMVFQKPNPFPMSVYDNIAYGPRAHGHVKKSELALSGGQQQRLCIARALAVNPAILLMDEPTSALDPISTGRIEELCMELKNNLTIVIVTHNMQQAARIAGRTAFFLLGDLIEYDETQTLFSRPSSKETEDYITGRFG